VKHTDYARVAARYDENEVRHDIDVDPVIGEMVSGEILGGRDRVTVLDLACGTGNHLAAQSRAYAGKGVRWLGLDASDAMLARAREKLPGLDLRQGRAESLPFAAGEIDYVYTTFAFHHFEDKEAALDEIARVLRDDGVFRVLNIDPPSMPGWWLYHFFPASPADDAARFWPVARLVDALERRGFDVEARVEVTRSYVSIAHVREHAERRELSQLAIASDEEHAAGLARIEALHAADPSRRGPTEVAMLRLVAHKTSLPRPRWE
jgi:ubiquinone/menaquinone biosynthesis C-methylase UbiE